ncbi:pyridoxal-dependent decarboxylase [Maricaulis sp.]|uniref:pyridoxal phosphate-dependent decarboxylase family protein n=1 Tax=Maricaulis sp. TaxID=1486257 RepID=UPI00260FA5B0|nr:pyridoxal-dependent decarboxylase [Maricaulis sp.]
MKLDQFEAWSKRIASWSKAYLAGLRRRPVRAQGEPGDVLAALPASAPENAEDFETIFADFERLVPDAMTHWQHPRFFAYFPANAAPVSMLAEQLANTIAAQCMLWQTSPAATEMETRMVDWLRQAMGLPQGIRGTIHDTASTATLAALLTMRERALDWAGNREGLSGQPRLRIYSSAEGHSSIDKAAWIAGIGQDNLVKVASTGPLDGMDQAALRAAIAEDRAAGYKPAGLVIVTGGTSVGAMDPVAELIAIAREEGLYTHVDAAWAGSAMICEEFRHYWAGAEGADSIVFNPHKWLGAQFECSVQFLANPEAQVKTLGLRPDYLETLGQSDIVNYSEWTIPLGRRFRALKLWFLMRGYGLEGLRDRIRNHVAWAKDAAYEISTIDGLAIVTEPRLSLFSFAAQDDAATEALLQRINDDGRTYLTQTRHKGRFVIRFQIGPFECTREDVMTAVKAVRELHSTATS